MRTVIRPAAQKTEAELLAERIELKNPNIHYEIKTDGAGKILVLKSDSNALIDWAISKGMVEI